MESLEKRHFFLAGLGLLLVWFGVLVSACAHDGVYWLLFQLLFASLAYVPFVFDSHESHGVWGAFGDFWFSGAVVSMFAFPQVLHNADETIGAWALLLTWLSNVAFVTASGCFGKMLSM